MKKAIITAKSNRRNTRDIAEVKHTSVAVFYI